MAVQETQDYHAQAEYTWSPPDFTFSLTPPITQSTLVLENDPQNTENFMRGAKWSPDGRNVLGHCENATYQLFELPEQAFQSPPKEGHSLELADTSIRPTASLRQPSPILDLLWYPTATRHDPASYCFVASVRECPVKLLDASTGRLRASYPIVDHCERQVAPHSMAFNLTATNLYCGFENAIEVFDVLNPGVGVRMHTTPSKKSKDGLKGIISALAFSPSGSYTNAYFAAGSLTPASHNIVLFSEAQGGDPIMYIGNGGNRSYGGVTQIRFDPTKPHVLYASFRGRVSHGRIYAWDLRAVGSGTSNPPYRIFQTYQDMNEEASQARDVNYNQKMLFDVDATGRWLSVGDQAGRISVFDLSLQGMEVNDDQNASVEPNAVSFPSFQFNAHLDAVGSVAFNPCFPLLLSASGSRHFHDQEAVDSDEDEEQDHQRVDRTQKMRPITLDRSVKIWNAM